jgi:putative transcriptional regulator
MRNRLKVLRAERNITQEELARLSGLSRFTVNAVENEAVSPSGETIKKLAHALKVSPSDIFFDLNVV